jgi:hypothetical protein
MDIRKLIEKGQAAQDAAHKELEITKRGNLRGGSAGVIGTDGKIYGECHRVALSRMLGTDKENDGNRSIMFDAGNANEDSWASKLIAAGAVFRREEEIPVMIEVGGKKVTGRPDLVLGSEQDGKFIPEFGIELKGVFSASTAIGVLYEGKPQAKHLAQAGFYSMALNVPYVIAYTNPSVIETPYWAQKKFGATKKIQPFYAMFYMRWTNEDVLEYRDEREINWVTTKYTKQGILDYFALVGEMEARKDLGPRPDGGYATGEPAPYDRCNYCALQKACDEQEDNFEAWMKMVSGKTE